MPCERGCDPKGEEFLGESGLYLGKLLVALLDCSRLGWDEGLQKGEELGGFEAFEQVVSLRTFVRAWGTDNDDGKRGVEFFHSGDEIAAGHVADAGVEDDAVQAGEGLQGVDRFESAVGGDDVELGGLDNEFARGDAAGVLTVDDKKAGPNHAVIIDPLSRFEKCRDHLAAGVAKGWAGKCDDVVVCGACLNIASTGARL